MNCEKAKALVEAFHDEALGKDETAEMEEHLAQCSSCRRKRAQLSALSNLIQRNCVPDPSEVLKQNLLQAFMAHHNKSSKSLIWWRQIFTGSVNVPKPIFAAALIVIAVILATASLISRNAANTSSTKTILSAQDPGISVPLESAEIIKQTKIVEIPVVKERIVTHVVYVEQKKRTPRIFVQNRTFNTARNDVHRNYRNSNPNEPLPNMIGSVANNRYFTQIDLAGFQPTKGMNARVIQQVKIDEK